MSLFVWYSKGSQESGEWLAQKLEADNHGTTPPKGFSGVAVCCGAAPKEAFRWENRNFRAVFNDPRKVRAYLDRKDMFDKLAESGVNVVSYVTLADEAQYVNICNILGAAEGEGFVACRKNGSKARLVTCQAELESAIAENCCRAIDRAFDKEAERIRVFVVDGNVIGGVRRGAAQINDAFLARAAEECGENWNNSPGDDIVRRVLARAAEVGSIAPAKTYWGPAAINREDMRQAARTAAAALEFDFCAVDFVENEGNAQVINVVTTPNLREAPSIHTPLINAISAWVERNTKTAKELLQDLINDATDEEASDLLDELRNIKNEAGGAA